MVGKCRQQYSNGFGCFLNDHFGNVKCFIFKLSLKTNISHNILPIILSTRRQIAVLCVEVSSQVIDFNCCCLFLSAL